MTDYERGYHQGKADAIKNTSMTLRDHFAGQAMQALITRETKMIPDPSVYAGAAYDLADAMLEASKNEIRNP